MRPGRLKIIGLAAAFLASFRVATFVLPELPLRSKPYPRQQRMPSFEVPGDDAFFAYSVSDELSQMILYHGLGDSIDHARQADILFVGNSRMPVGLREEVIVPEAEKLGLKAFSLACGHSEKTRFALDLIRKHDLRPKVVVAVGGPNLFTEGLSEPAERAEKLTRWQAWKERNEAEGKWAFQRSVHSWLPKIDWFGQDLTSKWIVYRSTGTGWWRPACEPSARHPVRLVREDSSYEQLLPAARELKEELDSRGALLVLTMVPYGATRSGHIPYLSDELGVPAVLPSFEGVSTNDGSHLNRESAVQYSKAFWDELIALPAVRAKLSISAPNSNVATGKAQVDGARLEATRAAIVRMRSMLEQYYGGPEVLRKTWYLQPDDPRYQKGLGFLADKIARSFVWRDRFVVGTIGSSVVAGFDNCHFDTYQLQLGRLLAPLWQAAGVGFEVRNTGQGGDCGDSFDNQVWCLRTLVGDDVDMTHYSWTYFESGTAQELQLYHELFYRWSLLMERSPVPQLIYTNDCSKFSQLDQKLLDAYGPFGADILCMERGIQTVGYPGKEWGVVGDTIHDTTRYGEAPGVSEERQRSLGVVFRNWHPGPLLFQTTADALAYKLSAAMLLALDQIASEPNPGVRWPQRPRILAIDSLPKPLACPEEWCSTPQPPRCLNYEEPTFGEQHFRRLDPVERANPDRPLADRADAGWTLWAGPVGTRYVPKEERQLPECAHPARCAGLVAPPSKQAGWLRFELPDLRLGFVAVCCSKKRCGQIMLDAGAEFLLDGEPPSAPPEAVRRGKCVQVQPRFEDSPTGQRRTVHLGIRLPARKEPIPAITHVIGL